MIHSIVASSVKFRLMVMALAVILLALGLARLWETNVEVMPNFGPVKVDVHTEALGLSPEEVENLITNPMEQEFFTGIPWLHKIRSKSAPGLSAVEMTFESGANDVRARQVVQERLTMVPALPAVSKPPYVIQPSATINRALIFSMSSKETSLIDLSTLARWKVRQRLLAVPGVSNVSIWGLRDRQLQVLVDPHRLRLAKINVDEVIRTAANAMWSSPLTYVEASTPGTGGFIETAHQRISINHTQPIKTAKELARITIEADLPVPVTLGEVAEVTEGHQMLIGDSMLTGDAPGLLMVVERTPDSSILKVTQDVERALEAMRPGMKGIAINTQVYRASAYVEETRRNLMGSLGAGLVLAGVLVLAFFMSWRAALVSGVALVLSLGTTWLLLSSQGLSLNLPIIAGMVLALSLLIDDAIVGVDAMRRRWSDSAAAAGAEGPFDALAAAAHQAAGPVVTTVVIVLLSVAPLWVLNDVAGDFIKPLALAYGTAVVVSALVALLVTPALASFLLGGPRGGPRAAPRAAPLAGAYQGLLRRVQLAPLVAAAVAAVLGLVGLVVMPMLLGANLMPELKDRDVLVRLQAEPGTSLPAMRTKVGQALAAMRAVAGVRSADAHIGRASTSDLVANVDTADLWVSLKPDADYDTALAAVQAAAKAQAGMSSVVGAYPNLRLRQFTTGNTDGLVVRVYGRNYEVLMAKAETVAKAIAEIGGISSPKVSAPVVEPTIEVEVNIDKASAKGVKPGDVRRAAATMLSSITAGQLFEDSKIFDVVVWGLAEQRNSVQSVKDTLVDGPGETQVRVGDVADVRVKPNPSVIPHDAVSRYIDVIAQVQGRSLESAAKEAEQRLKSINFPSEHHVEVMGDATEREQLQRNLLLYGLAACITLYFLLQARTESWALGLLLFAGLLVPLGAAALGGLLAGPRLSLLSLMGLLVVLAFAARGGLQFVERCRRIERAGGLTPSIAVVSRAAQDGGGALLMSVAASLLALAPLLVWGMSAGLEVLMPMALVIGLGLVGAALQNLLVLPVLYPRFAPPLAAPDLTMSMGDAQAHG